MSSSLFIAVNIQFQGRLRYLHFSRQYVSQHGNARVWKGQGCELIAASLFIISLLCIVSTAVVMGTG